MISVAIVFGAETVMAGILGIVAGSFLGQKLRRDYPTADPLVCGVGLLFSAPLMASTLILASGPSAITTFTLMFCGQLFLNFNWSLVADITLVKIKIVSVTWASCHDCVLYQVIVYVFPRLYSSSVSSYKYLFCLCLIFVP